MKNFGIIFLIFGLLFTSCGEESISQREKREAKELTKQGTEQENETIFKTPEPVVETVVQEPVVEEVTPVPYYEPAATYTQMTTIPTYWYMVFEEIQRDAEGKRTGSTNWHWCVKLNTPYFDFVEAMRALPERANGKCYFKNFIQVSKESYDSWNEFKRIYHGK